MNKRGKRRNIKKKKPQGNGRIRFWLCSIFPGLFLAIITILACWSWLKLTDPNLLPFTLIKIKISDRQFEPKVVKNSVLKSLNGGFFSLDINNLQQNLNKIPWIERVSIRRVWPSSLIINIGAQHPVARWGGSNILLNDKGQVFTSPNKEQFLSLPLLHGPEGSEKEVFNQYQLLRNDLEPLI